MGGQGEYFGTNLSNYKSILPINRIFFRIQTESESKMTDQIETLFYEVTPEALPLLAELQRPLLRHVFVLDKVEVALILTDNYVFLGQQAAQDVPTHFLPLTFEVKFETIYQSIPNQSSIGIPMAIRLERQHCSEQFTFNAKHPSIAECWSLELEKKINQRNFHSLFKAKKKIGKGAFATVYLAERLRDHKMVAVKAFSKEKQYSGDKGKQSLQNQIRLMRKLNHCNISKLEGVYETGNSIYVILEYLEGRQLNETLKNNRKFSTDDVRKIIQNILGGLSHLAEHRIIHRDLKPENIIFKKENTCDVAICDFGLATHADEEKYLFVRCGTPGFVAPEIINIKDMSSKSSTISDIFSVGIILHYLLFGCSVFQGKKYNEILHQNRLCHFNFQKEMYSQVEGHAFDLLTSMLEKDPLNRISAQDALNHPFFVSNMDIEVSPKLGALSPRYPFKVWQVETPTMISKRKEESFFNFAQANKQNTACGDS